MEIRKITRDNKRNKRELLEMFQKIWGPYLIFLCLFIILREAVLKPLGRSFWKLVLMTTPDSFISEKNLSIICKAPQIIPALFIIAFGFAVSVVWEMSGTIMAFEYYRRDKTVNPLRLLWDSLLQIRHIIKPRNWLVLVYAVVFLPFIDLYGSSQSMSALIIPEYISQFIFGNTGITIAFIILSILVFRLVVVWMFSLHYFVLDRMDFPKACRLSEEATKDRRWGMTAKILLFGAFVSLILFILPKLLLTAVSYLAGLAVSSYAGAKAASQVVFRKILSEYFDSIASMFIKLLDMLYIFLLMSKRCPRACEEAQLPETSISKSGKVRSFKGLLTVCFSGAVILLVILYWGLTMLFTNNPEYAALMIPQTEIAAHKGYSAKAPENTIPSFDRAVECGKADWIELDVRESSDGIPMVIHNESLYEATGNDIDIYDMTCEDIQKLPAVYSFSNSGEFKDTYIPTLEEVLDRYSGIADFIIEIKASERSPQLAGKVVELMRKYGITESSVVQSGNYETICAVKKEAPEIRCGLIIAMVSGLWYDLPNTDFFSVEHTFITESVVENIHKRGREIYAWTVNEDKFVKQMSDIEVDCMITDYPEDTSDMVYRDTEYLEKLANEAFFGDMPEDAAYTDLEALDEFISGTDAEDGM